MINTGAPTFYNTLFIRAMLPNLLRSQVANDFGESNDSSGKTYLVLGR